MLKGADCKALWENSSAQPRPQGLAGKQLNSRRLIACVENFISASHTVIYACLPLWEPVAEDKKSCLPFLGVFVGSKVRTVCCFYYLALKQQNKTNTTTPLKKLVKGLWDTRDTPLPIALPLLAVVLLLARALVAYRTSGPSTIRPERRHWYTHFSFSFTERGPWPPLPSSVLLLCQAYTTGQEGAQGPVDIVFKKISLFSLELHAFSHSLRVGEFALELTHPKEAEKANILCFRALGRSLP